ncbi:DUF4126 domain-containing protein [Selenihalanaerobacter shriftii]|uniref:DUF4126 domain-containing protein n=1 Tax=Selenihalanaerobacter shriftii TaxID=142842 RepID=A0A1T4NAH7_9FIRM|nr:DUF4126 domain-containing protein [Selenihalanaerobacter shriftii]SJZ76087.1 protein of unknown function [Selenihalanaerobacter shriftii]
MNLLLGLLVGIGLSAACGFRVFVPLLIMSVASISGNLELAENFKWISTYTAFFGFLIATLLEVSGYYIPWVDNLLDTVATPAAVVAGSIVTASCITEVSLFLQWSLAIIAGGTASGAVQLTTTSLRGASSATTGGMGNHFVSTLEGIGSTLIPIISILFPFFTILLVAMISYIIFKKIIPKLISIKRKVFKQSS